MPWVPNSGEAAVLGKAAPGAPNAPIFATEAPGVSGAVIIVYLETTDKNGSVAVCKRRSMKRQTTHKM